MIRHILSLAPTSSPHTGHLIWVRLESADSRASRPQATLIRETADCKQGLPMGAIVALGYRG